jgi:glycosyltransferase involved in cell wall biosynthesis
MQGAIVHLGKFYPPHMGGIETHVRDLVSGLSQILPVKVIVAGDSTRRIVEQLDGATVIRMPTFGTVASLPVTPTLPLELKRAEPTLLHVQVPNPGAAFAIVMAGYRGPLVITHQADTLGRRILKKITDPFVTEVMKRADRIIATSHRYLESSPELVPFVSKCRVIPMAISYDEVSGVGNGHAEELIRAHGPRILLAVGRLVPYKGFEYLVQAMRTVNATLLLIGKGPLEQDLKTLAATLGVSKKVKFLGRVDDVTKYYSATSIFVLPSISRAEAFGLVQLEAMGAGLPVINTDLDTGVPEISVNGITGITVPPADAEALARAINELLENDELRQRMGHAARERARQEFSLDLMISRTAKLYEEVLAERNSTCRKTYE